MGGGQARLAGTDDNDVVLAGVCEVGDGLGGLQECGQPGIGRAGIRERGRLRGGFRSAAREGARSHDSGGGETSELEQIATSNFHGDPPKIHAASSNRAHFALGWWNRPLRLCPTAERC